MGSWFDDFAFVQNHDFVGIVYGGPNENKNENASGGFPIPVKNTGNPQNQEVAVLSQDLTRLLYFISV